MDFLKSLLSDFDLAALTPDFAALFDKLDFLLRLAVMVGPLCLLGLGLLYLLSPADEANHIFGYRFFWGMSSVEAWQFTQRAAGICWSILGLVMTVVMAFICNGFQRLGWEAMLLSAIRCLIGQLAVVVISVLALNLLVLVFFDRKGCRRNWKKK